MPLLTDPASIQARLNRDRDWAAYAIGDLAPGYLQHCEWRAPASSTTALVLMYRGFDPPIVFAMGDPVDLRPLFDELTAPRVSLHVRPEALEAMAGIYTPTHTRPMLRMTVRPQNFRPSRHENVVLVGESERDAVTTLYEDGHHRGDAPDFFYPDMLRQKTFHGIWQGESLVAVAGTHLWSAKLGVCAVGNVYTRGDCRGRGLGARVTSAVVAQAIEHGITTIVLNVAHANIAARRVYDRLGFTPYCDFLEGEARRVP